MPDRIEVAVDSALKELIPRFLANRQKDVANLQQLLAKQDFDGIRVIGHSMKGVGSGYGFVPITEIGDEIENAAKEKNVQQIERLRQKLADYVARVDVVFK